MTSSAMLEHLLGNIRKAGLERGDEGIGALWCRGPGAQEVKAKYGPRPKEDEEVQGARS